MFPSTHANSCLVWTESKERDFKYSHLEWLSRGHAHCMLSWEKMLFQCILARYLLVLKVKTLIVQVSLFSWNKNVMIFLLHLTKNTWLNQGFWQTRKPMKIRGWLSASAFILPTSSRPSCIDEILGVRMACLPVQWHLFNFTCHPQIFTLLSSKSSSQPFYELNLEDTWLLNIHNRLPPSSPQEI